MEGENEIKSIFLAIRGLEILCKLLHYESYKGKKISDTSQFFNSLCTEKLFWKFFKNTCSTSAYKISLDDYIVPYKREDIIRNVSRIIPLMHAGWNDA